MHLLLFVNEPTIYLNAQFRNLTFKPKPRGQGVCYRPKVLIAFCCMLHMIWKLQKQDILKKAKYCYLGVCGNGCKGTNVSCVFFHGLLALQRLDTNKYETNQANVNETSAIMLIKDQSHIVNSLHAGEFFYGFIFSSDFFQNPLQRFSNTFRIQCQIV